LEILEHVGGHNIQRYRLFFFVDNIQRYRLIITYFRTFIIEFENQVKLDVYDVTIKNLKR